MPTGIPVSPMYYLYLVVVAAGECTGTIRSGPALAENGKYLNKSTWTFSYTALYLHNLGW